jgi:hypothetical protein
VTPTRFSETARGGRETFRAAVETGAKHAIAADMTTVLVAR